MSQENVEIIRAAIDAVNRGDLEGVLKDADPDFEFDLSRAVGPVSGVFNLHQARRAIAEFAVHWESLRMEAHEFIEAGDLVVVPTTGHLRGRDGIEVSVTVAWVWTIRDGGAERVTMYQERQDALEDLGLSEQDAHTESS